MAKPKKDTRPLASAPPTPTPVSSVERSATRKYAGLLFVFSFLLYANTLGHDYTQDDAIVLTDNMFTTQGVKGIPGILKYDTFYGFFKEPGKDRLVAGGRYRPFSLVTFALEVQVFGQWPFIGHLGNIVLFGWTVMLFFFVLLRLFPPEQYGKTALYAALAAALIFAAHPIHTEAVANIKGRDEILSLLGSLMALYLSLLAIQTNKGMLHWVGALCLFIGLLSKENAITYLALIPLAWWITGETKLGRMLGRMLPYVLAAGVFLGIRGAILGWSTGAPPMEFMNNPYLKFVDGQFVPFDLSERLATVVYTLGRYIQLLTFPLTLSHDYYPRHIDLMQFGDVRVLMSVLAYLALIGVGIWGLYKRSVPGMAVWFYLIPLSIVSNLIFPIGTHLAERLLFMPSIGFAIAVGILVFPLGKAVVQPSRGRFVVLGVLVLLLSVRTITRNAVWKDNFTLFTTDVRTAPNSAKLRNAVAGALIEKSLETKDSLASMRMLQEALGHAQQATVLHPFYTNAFLLQGNAYYYLREYVQAVAAYRRALAISPDYKDARENLPLALRDAGRYAGEVAGDLPQAMAYLKEAESLLPNDYEILRLLGIAHGMSQLHAEAIDYFTRAAALQPTLADAWMNLSTAYFASGNMVKGQEFLEKARTLQ